MYFTQPVEEVNLVQLALEWEQIEVYGQTLKMQKGSRSSITIISTEI